VLYRTNAQSEPLEQALAEAGVPYVLRGGERFFARREVRDAVVLLRGAARAADPAQPLGAATREALSAAGWSAEPPSGTGAVRERWESLQALAALADDLEVARPGATLSDLVGELDERAAAQHAPTVEGVTLASLHAAKGLEWDAVFLVGLSEGLLPISFAEGLTAVEEERRLLYVGVTRAREHLMLSWARSRTPGGRGGRKPSRFLDGLRPVDPAVDETRYGTTASGSRRGKGRPMATTCRTCGRSLATGAERKVGRCSSCPPTYDETTFEALRAWRLETSGEAKVPAYVVFTDATLTAIAETRPASLEELAGIAGVGVTKLERYGPAVLAVLGGGAASEDAPTDA
jgi:DNA helicase-2/ATP-dependent DNA helicase PcrA